MEGFDQTAGSRQVINWSFEYDDAGRITSVTDPSGQSTNIERIFDAQNQLQTLRRTLADGTQVILELDPFGRLDRMTDDLGTTTYTYDEFSRLTSVARSGQPPITYTYDTEDRITSMGVGNQTTSYTYDFLGRLASMDTPAGIVSYDYLTGQGQLIRTLPNGHTDDLGV